MGILGIENRTENWKTAYTFSPFFRDDRARLRLAKRLGESEETKQCDVWIELFWKGMRDFFHQIDEPTRNNPEMFGRLADIYESLFPDLRERVERFDPSGNQMRRPENWSYNPQNSIDLLASNLVNSEIDVVIETPRFLFVGEAKDEAGLGSDGQYVLVHQLIRQYVMAWTLVVLKCRNQKVVPFVVGDACKLSSLKNTAQVEFMNQQGWLPERNVLSWDEIQEIAKGF